MHITPLPRRAVSLSADADSGPAELRPEVRSAEGRSNHATGSAELRPEARSAAGRSDHPPHAVTELLRAWGAGDARAPEALVPLVYAELRRQAARALRREGEGHTLQATALVHEAWLRLDGQHDARWESRTQFLAVAAQMMRRVLVDHARARRALKRGGGGTQVTLGDAGHAVASVDDVDVLALDEALARLATMDPRKARLVELRYFAGMSIPEAATALGVSLATVGREWAVARMWLRRELEA
jgi:RNA polymerase sigma factor (TIGR02999 family)